MARRSSKVIAGMTLIGAAAWLAARRRADAGRTVRARGRVARIAAVAKLGGRSGATLAVHRARRTFAAAERRDALDTAFELRTAEQVADALGQMKGALMKIGQMASYLDQGLPEPVREALAQLQQDAPPMSGELAAQVIERELGRPVDQLFETWDPVPIAAASIGQVHRALTHDGRAVAVKVQYPDVDEAIRSDLDNAGLLFAGMGMMFPGLEPGPIVAEIRARLLEELDYELEAANQRYFASQYAGHPFIHVPAVVDSLSARRVLTTEMAGGVRFSEAERWPQEERDLAAEAIFRFVFRSLYRMHAFNGDPHPGNYLFEPGGRVTFLDFGLVKRFEPSDIVDLELLVKAMVFERDPAEYRRIAQRIGVLQDGDEFSDELVQDYFGHFYDFVLEDEPVTITPEWSAASMRRYFDPGGPYGELMKKANVPPFMVILQRINLGMFAVLGELHATANWRRIAEELWPWVDGPPSTPLGEQEAAWLRSRTE